MGRFCLEKIVDGLPFGSQVSLWMVFSKTGMISGVSSHITIRTVSLWPKKRGPPLSPESHSSLVPPKSWPSIISQPCRQSWNIALSTPRWVSMIQDLPCASCSSCQFRGTQLRNPACKSIRFPENVSKRELKTTETY